ncbi:diguanylate cyclase [Alcanivorax hongdengensis A-11-3]|uniref:diguanylate cyclase n=1 Tax=Alcanivorax hongdengensis A-11-3 TaxID=1177179 RepID=L0W9X2_9GAMM|nr:GGDEF domain-containing protein [Alcanivorax hongdengensis]EKF73766.1 diguanylate cyclase [Alcanivorax hongdengensis A-11-3]
MNQELNQARRLTLSERRLLRRHGRSALAILGMHTLLCVVYLRLGYFHLADRAFLILFGGIWAAFLVYLLLLNLGATLRLSEPSLSLPLITFCIGMYMVSGYYVDEFRLAVVMLFFAHLLLVSFRLRARVMTAVGIGASVSYAVMLWMAFQARGVGLSFSVEALQWLVFTMISISFAVTGGAINRLRNELADKNRALAGAVKQVRELAIRDDLTGLFNRGHLMEILERQKALADTGRTPFSVCYVDLDHFKKINDRFGHEWGDRVLKRFSDLAMSGMRDGDFFGRLGGEEFLLILPQSDVDGARLVAERLRKRWREQAFDDQGGPLSVSLSVGVASYHEGESVDELLHRADQGLYQAKSGGRDQTRVA